jgi:hypothetical protein
MSENAAGTRWVPNISPSFQLLFSPLSLTVLHAWHLSISSYDYCASRGLGHGRFSSECSRLLAFPCTKCHFCFDHSSFTARSFKSPGMKRPQYSESSAAKLRSSNSCWAFHLALSRICLTSFIPMPRAALLAITGRYSSPPAPGLLLSSHSSLGFSSSSMDQSQPI